MTFAAANTLNTSAHATRTAINDSIERTFTTRGKWTTRGTRTGPKARKTRLNVEVGTTREYLEDHVDGATRRGKNAIPTRAVRRNFARRVSRSRWPGALRGARYFAVRAMAGNMPGTMARRGTPGVAVFRRGRGKKRRPKLMWFSPATQVVKARWDFESVVVKSHEETVRREFPIELARAISTAK